jgi:hypothetical protein
LLTDLSFSANRTLPHGARELRSARADDYNVELREDGAFLGDHANKKAFQAMLDRWRRGIAHIDPLRGIPTEELYKEKQELEKILLRGDPLVAGALIGAIEDFSHSLCEVVERFLKLPAWRDTQRILIGAHSAKGGSASSSSGAPPSCSGTRANRSSFGRSGIIPMPQDSWAASSLRRSGPSQASMES